MTGQKKGPMAGSPVLSFARTILSTAVAPTQPSLFSASEELQGASQIFRARTLVVVEPLLNEAAKLLSEALASTASIEVRHRIEADTSLVQIVAVSDNGFEQAALERLAAAASSMAERVADAMAAIASPLPLTRSTQNQGDRLFDQVAQVKRHGVPIAFSVAILAGYVADLGALKFTEVPRRAKSTWLQDPDPETAWIEGIIRSSRSGNQLSFAPLNGAPAFQVDIDADDETAPELAAKAHALCGGSCWLKVRCSIERCKEAPELERHVHHLVDAEIRDASQLKSLRRRLVAMEGLTEQAEAFERAALQRANRKRPQDPPPGPHPAA